MPPNFNNSSLYKAKQLLPDLLYTVVYTRIYDVHEAKFLIPDWVIDSTMAYIGLSYYIDWRADSTSLCHSRLYSPGQGLRIWLLDLQTYRYSSCSSGAHAPKLFYQLSRREGQNDCTVFLYFPHVVVYIFIYSAAVKFYCSQLHFFTVLNHLQVFFARI